MHRQQLSDNDNNNLRGRPVGVSFSSIGQEATPSSSFERVLQNILNTSEDQLNEDLDAHYPLYLTNNERTQDDYDINDVLLSFTIRNPSSDVMRQPPGRKLAEAAHADAAHGEGEGDHGDAHDIMVVHVTYENIWASYNPFLRDRLITGLAMTCRGEFSSIIAAFALGKGLITAKIYAAIVWAVLLSCVTSPFILLSIIKYFNKQQLEYLKATNPSKQKTGFDGMTPLYLHIKSTAPASWGQQQEVFRKILNDMNLEVIDRRTNRHGRSLAAEVQTDLYVKTRL